MLHESQTIPKPKFELFVGAKIGRLTIIGERVRYKETFKHPCRCICGKEVLIIQQNLRTGKAQSCGCRAIEGRTKHGHRISGKRDPEYYTWVSMKDRCLNPRNKQYANYGGRGISVCEEWVASYEEFLNAVGRRPSNKHSLDRYPNNDGNYEPGNVRWATQTEQARNRRNNVLIAFRDQAKCLMDWCREFNLPFPVVRVRLSELGWTIEAALTTPIDAVNRSDSSRKSWITRKANLAKLKESEVTTDVNS